MQERAAKDGLPIPPELQEEVELRAEGPWKYHLTRLFRRGPKTKQRAPQTSSSRGTSSPGGTGAGSESDSEEHGKSKKHDKHAEGAKVSAHMIRRMDNAPQLVDPSGWISSGHASTSRDRSNSRSQPMGSPPPLLNLPSTKPTPSTAATTTTTAPHPEFALQPAIDLQSHPTIETDGGASDRATLSQISHPPNAATTTGYFPRSTTVEFANPPKTPHHARKGSFLGQNMPPSAMAGGSQQQQQGGSTNLGVETSPTHMRRSQSRPDDRSA